MLAGAALLLFTIERLHELLLLQALPHIRVCSFDELPESRGIDVAFGPEFHMAHELAGAFQQVLGIGNLGSAKEPDIDVSFEGIDIGECRVTYTRGRVPGME